MNTGIGRTFSKAASAALQFSLLAVAIYWPLYRFAFDASIVLTCVSLLFTILIGFFIAATTSKYLSLQSLITREDACLISLQRTAKLLDVERSSRITEAIDAYLISALDYDLLDYPAHINREYEELLAAIDSIEPRDQSRASLLQNFQTKRDELISIRTEARLAAQRIVSRNHWTILVLLAALISIILLAFRSGDIFSSVIIGLIIIVVYQTLRLLAALDSNAFLADKFGYREPQQVFLAIGRLKYFPETALASDRRLAASLKGERYRIGNYTDRPHSLAKTIKIVNGDS